MRRVKSRLRNVDKLGWGFEEDQWVPARFMGNMKPTTLKTITFNVMNDPAASSLAPEDCCRYRYILNTLASMQCHVIGLNEVTNVFLGMLMEQDWIRKDYLCSHHPDHCPVEGFASILLIRKASCAANDSTRYPLNWSSFHVSGLTREIISAEYFGIALLACHLKAGFHADFRVKEFHDIEQWFRQSKSKQAILMGDFNMIPNVDDPDMIPENYTDVWEQLRPEEAGYTWDFTSNRMLYNIYPSCVLPMRSRLDRMYIRSAGATEANTITPDSIRIVFDEPIFQPLQDSTSKLPFQVHVALSPFHYLWRHAKALTGFKPSMESYLYASDHYGLVAEFTIT
jgi:endonuclease/exonuclease/phosphatase family metal-dependent hydrolase